MKKKKKKKIKFYDNKKGYSNEPDTILVYDKKTMIGYFKLEILFPLVQAKLISLFISKPLIDSNNCFVDIFIPKSKEKKKIGF